MDRLNELLLQYKNITEELITCLESENYDPLDELLNKRQDLIDTMNALDYPNDRFKTNCEDMGLPILQKKLDLLYAEKLNTARANLKQAVSGKQVHQSYGRASHVDSIFFNKKI